MIIKGGRNGPFLGCSGYPDCRNTLPLSEDGKTPLAKVAPELTEFSCEKCDKPMVVKESKRGKFLGCSGFPKCRNAKPLPESSPKLLGIS